MSCIKMYKNCIRVYSRLKPNFNETSESCFNYEILPSNYNEESLLIRTRSTENVINNKPDMYSFQFSKVFNEKCSQEEVYNVIAKPVIERVLQGYNGTIFAYGQTGSGKTFTISGNFYDDESQAIVHRSLRAIFKEIGGRINDECKVDISFLEIYNEIGRDLFNQDIDERIILQEDEDGEIQLKNLSIHNVRNYDEFISMYRSGESIRSESITTLNQYSSRSHCILTVYLTIKIKNSSKVCKSKLHIIDLAGSERISKTQQNSQTTIVEARHINLSLHYLEQVIIALGEKNRTHIPYRNSMMTTVLRDSLGGNCLTAMIATLATSKCNLEESLSTCRFAQRVALVKNEAKLNTYFDNSQFGIIKAEFDTIRYQMTENVLSKAVTQALKEINIKYLKKHEIEECKKFIENFIFDNNNNSNGFTPIIENPKKIKVCFEIFKNLIEDIQKKSVKAEKQAYSMYKRIIETRMNNKKENKYTKTLSTVKILPTRPSTAKGAIFPSSVIKVNTNKSQRVHENNDCNNISQKQYEGGRISQVNRTQSYTHRNCVSNQVFEEKMKNLENIIEECKKAHEKEYDKLSAIQKLMEDNAQSQKSSLTDLNILRAELMKINKFKCEKENKEHNIAYYNDKHDTYANDEEKIIFTYDASKTYVDNDEEFNDEIYTSCQNNKYENNNKESYEQECKTNELLKYGRIKTESSRKGLITSSEPSIHQSKTENIKFFNDNSIIDNPLNVYCHDTQILTFKPNERKFIKAQSLQRIPETNVLLQKKFLRRNDKTLKSTWIDHQRENNNTYENIDISTHYEGNSLLISNDYIYDKYNEEELLKEAQNNAVKSFYDKFGMKTVFKDQKQISSSNKFNNPSAFVNDYEINNCDRKIHDSVILNYNEDTNDYKNDNSYETLEKHLELQKKKRSISNFIPIRKQFMHKADTEKEYNEENAEKINIFNFTSDLKSNIAKTLHSSLTTLNMITTRSIDNESHDQIIIELDQQANSGIDNTNENLCKTIPLTGDPDIDDEVIAFYKRQNYSIYW